MKIATIVCVLLCCYLQTISANDDVLDEDEKACIEETGVSEALVIEADESFTVPSHDPLYKDFLSCCWKRFGYQRADGEIEWDSIRTVLSKAYHKASAVDRLITECEEKKGDTHGETVVLVLKCLDEHAASLKALHGYYAGHHS